MDFLRKAKKPENFVMWVGFILVLMWRYLSFLGLCLRCQTVFFTTTSRHSSPKYESLHFLWAVGHRFTFFFYFMHHSKFVLVILWSRIYCILPGKEKKKHSNTIFVFFSTAHTWLATHFFIIKLQYHKLYQFIHELEKKINPFLLYYECLLCCSGTQNIAIWILQIHKQNWLIMSRF